MATPQRFLSLSRIGNATAENLTVLPSSVRALAHRAAVFCALILPMWPTGRLHLYCFNVCSTGSAVFFRSVG